MLDSLPSPILQKCKNGGKVWDFYDKAQQKVTFFDNYPVRYIILLNTLDAFAEFLTDITYLI